MHSPPCPPSRGGLTYWALHYQDAPFHRPGLRFRDYAPALYLGISGFVALPDIPFEFLLPRLRARYASVRGASSLSWKSAIPVVWAAWERASTVQSRRVH